MPCCSTATAYWSIPSRWWPALSEMLTARGWPLTPAQAGEVFLGQSVAHLAGLIAERTGKPFTEQWLEEFRQQRNRALEQDLEAIQGRLRPCVRSP